MGVPLLADAANWRTFSALFEEGGRNLALATGLLHRMMGSWPDEPQLREEIKALEEQGDRVTHDILHALPGAKDMAIDRRDIHALASALDDAVDNTEEAADLLGLYKIEAPMEQGIELTAVLRDCGREVGGALSSLSSLDRLNGHVAEISRLEDEGDRISREALVDLFIGGIDPMVVIRWKDLFERLEQAIDACDSVGHILEGITVKYS
jgi:uncharacterized protein Yka (UPF0111/DUF47 family)